MTPFCHYTNCNKDFTEFDLELGFPAAGDVPEKDGMYITKTYEGRAVEATHKGSYHTMETTYAAIMRYIQENALEMTGEYYEWYLNDPDNTPEEELLTRVVYPVK